MEYKVLTRSTHSTRSYRTFREFPTLDEAMAAAARIEKNSDGELEAIVELPGNRIEYPPLRLLELTA